MRSSVDRICESRVEMVSSIIAFTDSIWVTGTGCGRSFEDSGMLRYWFRKFSRKREMLRPREYASEVIIFTY